MGHSSPDQAARECRFRCCGQVSRDTRESIGISDQGGPDMTSNHTTELITAERPLFDEARLAVPSFLARYSGPPRVTYTADLKNWFAWCHQCGLEIFGVRRGHLELWARA